MGRQWYRKHDTIMLFMLCFVIPIIAEIVAIELTPVVPFAERFPFSFWFLVNLLFIGVFFSVDKRDKKER